MIKRHEVFWNISVSDFNLCRFLNERFESLPLVHRPVSSYKVGSIGDEGV